jgi:hypothetical protein
MTTSSNHTISFLKARLWKSESWSAHGQVVEILILARKDLTSSVVTTLNSMFQAAEHALN